MTSRMHTIFAVVSGAVVLGTITWGIVVAGTPGDARAQRLDEQRLGDLQTIVREMRSLCYDPDDDAQLKRPLPATLDELSQLARSERVRLTDPETGEPYEFTIIDPTTYSVCAEFSTERDSDWGVFWNHPPGRHCFVVDALDPP